MAKMTRETLRHHELKRLEREVERPSIEAWLRDVRANDVVVDGPCSADLVRAARMEG